MSPKNISIIAFILILGGLSVYLNKDWFASDVIQISDRSIVPRDGMLRGPAAKAPCNPVVFLFSRKLKLTSVKVVLAEDATTNKFPRAIWDLVTDSNSIPVKDFIYGAGIRGMRPAVKGVGADPLEPGVKYRLLVRAGSDKLEHDFVPVPRTR